MSDSTLKIQVNLAALQAIPLRKLQRLIDMLRFSRAGSELVMTDHYPGLEFFTLNPSQNTQMSLVKARDAARDWLTLHTLRDAIEAVSLFLENVRTAAAVYTLAAKREVVGSEFNAIFAENRRFHRLGLPHKLTQIKERYGISSEFDSHLLSLNAARNCIVHRDGLVTPLDIGASGQLAVTFLEATIVAIAPDGMSKDIVEPGIVEAGWSIKLRTCPQTKSFSDGEQIVLSHTDLLGALFSLNQYVNNVAAALQRYAETLGFQFAPPKPAA